MRNRATLESSAALRALINSKRARGQIVESIVLARLGARVATQGQHVSQCDEISCIALTRYLELMPDDPEAREVLARIALQPATRKTYFNARWLLWLLFITCGISTAGAIHINGFPMKPEPLPLQKIVIKTVPHVVPAPAASVVANASNTVQPIVIRAVGDVVLGSNFPKNHLPGKDEKKRIAALRDELRSADIVVGNLEGVLYDRGKSHKDTSKPGLFSFRMPESYAATLREMGFDVLSLANNHSMDFGEAGLAATIQALQAEQIQAVGVPGAEIAKVKVRNTTVAFLNYSYLPSFARLDDEQRVGAEIRKARSEADMVIVLVHAGMEGTKAAGIPPGDEYFMNEYRGNILKFSHIAIDSGATAVFGHGPHVVRPYEIYKGKPIFFSLGNFVGYRSLSTRGTLGSSIIAEVRFTPEGKLLGTGVIPLKIDRLGIPTVDYSAATLNTLDVLLNEQFEKRPVLKLSGNVLAESPSPDAQLAVQNTMQNALKVATVENTLQPKSSGGTK